MERWTPQQEILIQPWEQPIALNRVHRSEMYQTELARLTTKLADLATILLSVWYISYSAEQYTSHSLLNHVSNAILKQLLRYYQEITFVQRYDRLAPIIVVWHLGHDHSRWGMPCVYIPVCEHLARQNQTKANLGTSLPFYTIPNPTQVRNTGWHSILQVSILHVYENTFN